MSASKKTALVQDKGATLNFYADWQQSQAGLIRQGELLTIHYDPQRLTACRPYHDGMPAWDLWATVRFSPSGESTTGNLVEHVGPQGVLVPPKPVPLSVRIPADATDAEMWFENTSMISSCSAFENLHNSSPPLIVRVPLRNASISRGCAFLRICSTLLTLREPVPAIVAISFRTFIRIASGKVAQPLYLPPARMLSSAFC